MAKLLGKRAFWLGVIATLILAAVFFSRFNPAALISSQQKANDALIAEKLAHNVGTLAYVYGYPLVDMAKQMHNETHRVSADQQVYAPLNSMYYFEEIVGPGNAGNLRLPNNDTLYFSGWFNIEEQPLIIHTPDTRGRYFTIAVTNQYSEVVHIGRRTHGTEEAYYALVAPHWSGSLPAGVTAIEVETPKGWMLGRVLVDGQEDFPAALAVMKGIWSVPLDKFTPGRAPKAEEETPAAAINPLQSLEYFEYMNRALKSLPARPSEAALLAQFDLIGIGPNSNLDIAALSEATRRGLEKALADGMAIVKASEVRTIPSRNGWMIPGKVGRYGFDYLQRASVVANGYGNLPEESTYAATVTDADGNMMSGDNVYKIHFDAGQIPPVDGFWSIIAYALPEKQVQENAIGRYSIGDRTRGLKYNPDGSLTLWLQAKAPENPDKNWLPVPDGYFMAVVRMYEPREKILSEDYNLSRIQRVKP
jgi:hypothetical protein